MSVSPSVAPVPDTIPQGHVPEAAPPPPPPAPVVPAYNPPPPQMPAPSASLYVGELDSTVSEAMLFEIFNMVGPVARCVCFQSFTLQSLLRWHIPVLASAFAVMLSLVAPLGMLMSTTSMPVMVRRNVA